MRIAAEIRSRVVEIDRRYRSSWDVRSIAHVVGISPASVAKILAAVRGPRPKKERPSHDRRTRFLQRDVMWSSDFMELPGKRWLIKTLDEMSRYRPGWHIVKSQTAEAAVHHGEDLIARMGRAPLVWKFDHGSPFTSERFQDFLRRHKILPYPTQPRAPWTNGRVERDHQEIENWLIGVAPDALERETDDGMMMLNYVKPRAVLNYRKSAEVYFNSPGVEDIDRDCLMANLVDIECQWGHLTGERLHRRTIRELLKNWSLYEEWKEIPKRPKSVNTSGASDVAF